LTVRKLGNILTGDGAAASRYIEARLSNLLWKLFTVKITDGVFHDGRRAEPNNLPVKFPLLLAQGAEGIAGLSTKSCLIISMN
jgi:topoisomerase-4 subunit A